MYSFGLSVVLTAVVLSEFVFHVACHDSDGQGFEVESKTICYFAPKISSVDWDTAWRTCRELNATLPVILNEKGQKLLTEYLRKHYSGQSVWAAGRYVGSSSDWRWLNGQAFSGSDNPACPRNESSCHHETQSVLTKEINYGPGARFPGNKYAFVCNNPGTNCGAESQKSTPWKGGCLRWTPNHRLRLNMARNECLKGGGDLATFSGDGDFQELSSVMKNYDTEEYWIGLHRKWWIWNATDNIHVHDIKYNLLEAYGETGEDCLFIYESSKWNRDKCSDTNNVICQTDNGERMLKDKPSTAFTGIIVGSALLVILICIIILVIIIVRMKIRNTSKKANDEAGIDQTYEDLHSAVAIASVDTGIYTDLVPTQLRRNVGHHEDHVYEDVLQ